MISFEQLNPSLPDELAVLAANIPMPGRLADLIAANLNLSPEDRQAVLDALDPAARLRLILGYLDREREILAIGQRAREVLPHVLHAHEVAVSATLSRHSRL
jgi:ATP-dependent Lon protease